MRTENSREREKKGGKEELILSFPLYRGKEGGLGREKKKNLALKLSISRLLPPQREKKKKKEIGEGREGKGKKNASARRPVFI